jgi:hypothetical protein
LTVGGTGVAWQNSWGNIGGATTRYRKIGNKVTIQGGATGGTANQPAFTLPSGYYSTTNQNAFLAYAGGTIHFWQVLTTGGVSGDGAGSFPELTVTVD